jgi:hypothetical protein
MSRHTIKGEKEYIEYLVKKHLLGSGADHK